MNTSDTFAKASQEKPWLQFYPEHMRNFQAPTETLSDFIKKNNKDHLKKILEYYGNTFSLEEIFSETDRVAKAISALGVGEGDKFLVFLRATPEFLFVLFACEQIGATIICHDGTPDERAAAIKEADARLIFTYDFITAEEEAIYYSTGCLKNIVMAAPYTYANREEIPEYIDRAITGLYENSRPVNPGSLSWLTFIKGGEAIIGDATAPKNPDRHLYCSYTSGSTGPSKLVIHSGRSMNGVLGQLLIPGGTGMTLRVLHTLLPPALVAIVNSILLYNIASGNYLILDTFCEPEDIDLEFMRYKPNQVIAVPMMAEVLMKSKRIPEDYPMNDLYVIGGGADPVHNKWLDKIQSFLRKHGSPAVFSMCYGLSEAGSTATNPHPDTDFRNCCGGIPMRGTTISVFKPGTQEELPYGEVGEICTHGPSSMLGYSNPEDTAKTLQLHEDGNIWVHTGDYGCMNSLGELFVYSRGLNHRFGGGVLYTTLMENKVIEAVGVEDCFFVIAPDKEHEGCFLPYLYLVLEAGFSLCEVEKEVRDRLEDFEQPVKIFLTKEREYFHFKTNRRILAEKILAGGQ